jgi:hypothetical protein
MAAPIFILSGPRTGSTLLRYLIDSHPEICSPGEVRLGALSELLAVAFELTLGQTTNLNARDGAPPSYFGEVRRILDGLMNSYCQAKSKQRWCEKTPQNLDHLDFLNAVFPDAQCVCLHRHGLDCVRSEIEMRHPEVFVQQAAGADGVHGRIAEHIERWCQRTERLLAFESAYSDRMLRMTYEDLVEDPERELQRVWEFLRVQRVSGLSEKVFAMRHDDGPGDYKIIGSSSIEADRIGHGLSLDVSRTPEPLRRRMVSVLDALGYS